MKKIQLEWSIGLDRHLQIISPSKCITYIIPKSSWHLPKCNHAEVHNTFFFKKKLKPNLNIQFTISAPSSPPSFSLYPFSVPALQSSPPPFLFRKVQVSHEYFQNMPNQVAVRLSNSKCIKTEKSYPVWRIGFPKRNS